MSEQDRSVDAYVCIDGIICTIPEDDNYEAAEPIPENIAKINKLFYSGEYHVICWTDRGCHTGFDWIGLTQRQLDEWGVKYDQIRTNKPPCRLIIDPKAKRIEELDG